jgi:hypothetical protein
VSSRRNLTTNPSLPQCCRTLLPDLVTSDAPFAPGSRCTTHHTLPRYAFSDRCATDQSK